MTKRQTEVVARMLVAHKALKAAKLAATERTNADRATDAMLAVCAHRGGREMDDDTADIICDIVADLMHLCGREKIVWPVVERRAAEHHAFEAQEQEDAEELEYETVGRHDDNYPCAGAYRGKGWDDLDALDTPHPDDATQETDAEADERRAEWDDERDGPR